MGPNNQEIHKKKCTILKTRYDLCDEAMNILDYEDHLNVCKKQSTFCEKLKIYYSSTFEEAYKEEFNVLLSKFNRFY